MWNLQELTTPHHNCYNHMTPEYKQTMASHIINLADVDGARFDVPTDTKMVISETLFPAYLLGQYQKNKVSFGILYPLLYYF